MNQERPAGGKEQHVTQDDGDTDTDSVADEEVRTPYQSQDESTDSPSPRSSGRIRSPSQMRSSVMRTVSDARATNEMSGLRHSGGRQATDINRNNRETGNTDARKGERRDNKNKRGRQTEQQIKPRRRRKREERTGEDRSNSIIYGQWLQK